MNYDKYTRPVSCSWCNQYPLYRCEHCQRWMCSWHGRLHYCKGMGKGPKQLATKPRKPSNQP